MLLRLSAAVIALAALVGLILEAAVLVAAGRSILDAIWTLAGFFTILTNGLVAVIFGAIALVGAPANRPRRVAFITSAIVLVGVVVVLLLPDARPLGGTTVLSDALLHRITPVLALLFWAVFAPKGHLGWRDPLLWALYPLAYLAYGLVRGSIEGRYAYPFIDLGALGWGGVLAYALAIAAGFVVAGGLLVVVDGLISRRATK